MPQRHAGTPLCLHYAEGALDVAAPRSKLSRLHDAEECGVAPRNNPAHASIMRKERWMCRSATQEPPYASITRKERWMWRSASLALRHCPPLASSAIRNMRFRNAVAATSRCGLSSLRTTVSVRQPILQKIKRYPLPRHHCGHQPVRLELPARQKLPCWHPSLCLHLKRQHSPFSLRSYTEEALSCTAA